MDPHDTSDSAREPRPRWRNPLTDGWEYRWDVLVAVPDRAPATIDAVLASIDSRQANTVVQVTAGALLPQTQPSSHLAFAAGVPVVELLDGIDVAVLDGDALAVLAALRSRVPVVVLPTSAARAAVGQAVEAAGAGLLVHRVDEVGAAVARIASDGTRSARMRDVSGRLAVVDVLLTLLGTSALRFVRRAARH